MTRSWCAALLAVLFSLQPLTAQVTASIAGRVLDAGGAAVNDAAITVTSLETGLERHALSEADGSFRILSFPIGPVRITADKAHFKRETRTGINLIVGQEASVTLQLELGEARQEVTVSAGSPLVNTATAEVSGLVGERAVKDLPLNGRSWDNLIALNPGAISYPLRSANTTTSNGNTFSVSGRRPADNVVLLNGIEYTGASLVGVTPGGVSGGLLGIDAVREFNVLTDTYPAEYGKRSGGQVSVVTQSGTNQLHGTLFEFLRNSALDARNYFDNGPVPPLRRNQFGGALGGPIVKDRLFVFGNYEGFRQSLSVSNVSVVPDSQARLGLLPDSSGVYRPVTNLDPSMLKYTAFWPLQNGAELTVNGKPTGTALSYNSPRQKIREDFGTLRSDYIARDSDMFAFSYTVDDGDSLTPQPDPLFGSDLLIRSQIASVQETHTFSAQALNTFRAGLSRAAFGYTSFPLVPFPAADSFVTGENPGGLVISGGQTTTGLSAITSAGPNNASNVASHRNLFTFSDDFQLAKGKHQLNAGVWLQRLQDNENSATITLGQANFTSLQTFLQGNITNLNVTLRQTELGWRTLLGAWYVDDKYKPLPNLTIELGVRHEFTTGWNEVAGRASNYITNPDGVLLTNPRVGDSALTQNNAKRLFAPRAALAWDPFGHGKTSIRAGFGMYYSLLDSLARLNALPPYNGTISFANVRLSSILPINPNTPAPPSCSPTLRTGCSIYSPQGVQPDTKTPTVERWSFRLEQELDAKTVLRLAYIGSFGYHDLVSIDPNTIPAQVCASATGCTSGGTGAFPGHVSQGAQYIPVGTRPNPYLSSGFFWYSEGNSSYHALQADVVRRLNKNLELRGNFTWSKNLDIGSALQGAQANNQAQMVMDRNDLHRDWGPSALDVGKQGSISGTYALPWGVELNGIATLLSGFPFTPQIGANRSGDGDTRNPDRPSLASGFTGPIILGTQTQWFNPNAFVRPTAGTYGNLGRGDFRGPGLVDLDLSIFKNFRLVERAALQVRAECFNIANHANFGTPNPIVFSGTAISPSAGLISNTVTTSRQLQFGMKLTF